MSASFRLQPFDGLRTTGEQHSLFPKKMWFFLPASQHIRQKPVGREAGTRSRSSVFRIPRGNRLRWREGLSRSLGFPQAPGAVAEDLPQIQLHLNGTTFSLRSCLPLTSRDLQRVLDHLVEPDQFLVGSIDGPTEGLDASDDCGATLKSLVGGRGFGLQAEVFFFRSFGSKHGGLETAATGLD